MKVKESQNPPGRQGQERKLSFRQRVGGGWLLQEADDLTSQDIEFEVKSP